jgi:hypothetical protein
MSSNREFQLCCSCGYEFKATLWDALNVTENKKLKPQLLNGDINVIKCKKCNKRSYIEKDVLYHDMDKKLWVQMFPQADRSKWHELEEEQQIQVKKRVKSDTYHFRMAFGREELLEKIRIFDANLDDRAIELLKVKVVEEDKTLKDAADLKILFSRCVPEDAEIQYHVTSQENNISQTVVVSYDHYEEILETEEHLKLTEEPAKVVCDGMYINIAKIRVLH